MRRLLLLIISLFGTQGFLLTNLSASDPNVKINCSFYNTSIWISSDFFRYNVSISNPTRVTFWNEMSQPITGCERSMSGSFHVTFPRFAECSSGVVNQNNLLLVHYMLAVSVSTAAGPVRDIPTCIKFVCRFNRNLSANNLALKPNLRRLELKNLSAPGNFETRFDRCSSSGCGTTIPFSDPIFSGDRIYFQLSSQAVSYFNLVLQATFCWATSTKDPNSSPRFTFIDRGCPKDSTIIYENFNGSRSRFSITAFTWVDTSNGDDFYLHCTVCYCTTASGKNCSNQEVCSARRKRFVQPESKGEIVTRGPFHITPKCDKKLLGCSHECKEEKDGSHVCSCPPGYNLASDKKTCQNNQGRSFSFYNRAKETILIVRNNKSISSLVVVGLLCIVVMAMIALLWRMYKRKNGEKRYQQMYTEQKYI